MNDKQHKPQAGFTLYRESLVMLALLSEFEAGHIIQAASRYFLYGSEPTKPFSDFAATVWEQVRFDIDKSRKRYKKICEANAKKSHNYHAQKEKGKKSPGGISNGTSGGNPTPNSEPLTLNDELQMPNNAPPASTGTKKARKKQGDETEELKKQFLKDNAAVLQPSQASGGETDG